jgi:hypothetical protein
MSTSAQNSDIVACPGRVHFVTILLTVQGEPKDEDEEKFVRNNNYVCDGSRTVNFIC